MNFIDRNNAPLKSSLLLPSLKRLAPSAEPVDLTELLSSYECDSENMKKAHDYMRAKIRNFDAPYGSYLSDHLEWTSRAFGTVLKDMGYDDQVARNAAFEFSFHDGGKTEQSGKWKLTESKQSKRDDERKTLNAHTLLLTDTIERALRDTETIPDENDWHSITAKLSLGFDHHERLNGSGPRGKTGDRMHPILRAATIVDAFHGKLKAADVDADRVIAEMAGTKHEGQFDLDILDNAAPILVKMAESVRPLSYYLEKQPAQDKTRVARLDLS